MTHDTSRHDELFNKHHYRQPVWVFGTGGTGGVVSECLVGLGVGQEWSPIHLCDPDCFESHNVPTQLVTYHQAKYHAMKADAVRQNLLNINPEAVIHTHKLKAPHPSLPPVRGVAFLCLDNMKGRKEVIEELLEDNPEVTCVIDVRMDVPGALTYCFNPNDPFQVGCYFDEWYDDDNADEMLGCNNEHFALRSSILGAGCLAMKRFEDFARCGTTKGIPNYAKIVYHTGFFEMETWVDPTENVDEI